LIRPDQIENLFLEERGKLGEKKTLKASQTETNQRVTVHHAVWTRRRQFLSDCRRREPKGRREGGKLRRNVGGRPVTKKLYLCLVLKTEASISTQVKYKRTWDRGKRRRGREARRPQWIQEKKRSTKGSERTDHVSSIPCGYEGFLMRKRGGGRGNQLGDSSSCKCKRRPGLRLYPLAREEWGE